MTIATALLVLGCSGDPKSDDAVPSTTPSAPTPRLVESLSAAAYKKLLGQIDASLARDVAKVMKAPNMTAFDKARADLEASVAAQKAVLEKVRGPADYNGHPAVFAAFDVFPSNMIQDGLEAATTKTARGLPRPTTVRLYQAKNGIRTSIVQLTTSVNKAFGLAERRVGGRIGRVHRVHIQVDEPSALLLGDVQSTVKTSGVRNPIRG